MNRLAKLGILPNLSSVVKFIGGPWDGFYTRLAGGPCPEFLDVGGDKQKPHTYQLWIVTDNKGVTHTCYKHRGPVQ